MRNPRTQSSLLPVLTMSLILVLSMATAAQGGAGSTPMSFSVPGDHDQKPLTEKELSSGAFRRLLETTGASILELNILYTTSGAEDFKEFSRALMVSRILGLNHGLVLRALYAQDLDDVLRDLGIGEKQAKLALKVAKKELDEANKKWGQNK